MNTVPVKMVMHSADQVRLGDKFDIQHVDATGGILRRSNYTHGALFLFSLVPEAWTKEEDIPCVSASDFVTEKLRCEDITYWLHTFACSLTRLCGNRYGSIGPKVIVSDLSWAIIHASLLVFCGCRIDDYLQVSILIEGYRNLTTVVFSYVFHVLDNTVAIIIIVYQLKRLINAIRMMLITITHRITSQHFSSTSIAISLMNER